MVRVKKKVIEELKDIVNDIKEERKEEIVCQKTMEQPKAVEMSVEEKTIEPEKEVLVEEPVPAAEENIEMTEATAVVEKIVEPQEQAVMENAEQKAADKKAALTKAEEKGRAFLSKIFEEMKLDVVIDIKEKNNYLVFDLKGDNLGILIGRRGDTLDSLQFLLNLVINE